MGATEGSGGTSPPQNGVLPRIIAVEELSFSTFRRPSPIRYRRTGYQLGQNCLRGLGLEMTMSEIVNPNDLRAADGHSAKASKSIIHQIWNHAWPGALVGLGLGLSAIWMLILGYGLVELIGELVYLAI